MILWAYKTACKNPTVQALLRLKYKANIVSPIVHERLRPRMIAPLDTTIHETLEEEIQLGNSRLQEIEEERVRLRKKSALVDMEIKKLENEIKEDFHSKKARVIR